VTLHTTSQSHEKQTAHKRNNTVPVHFKTYKNPCRQTHCTRTTNKLLHFLSLSTNNHDEDNTCSLLHYTVDLATIFSPKMISHRYSSCSCCCCCSCWGDLFKKARDEIWLDCSSSKYLLIDRVRLWYDVIFSRWQPWRPSTTRCCTYISASCPLVLWAHVT